MGERMTEIYKADIVYAPTLDLLEEIESGYIVVRNGEIEGVYDTLPEKYDKEKITELGGLLIPGMTDMLSPLWDSQEWFRRKDSS